MATTNRYLILLVLVVSTDYFVTGCLCPKRRSRQQVMESFISKVHDTLRNMTKTSSLAEETHGMHFQCNKEIKVFHGSVDYWTSPDYPQFYPDDLTCTLNITVPRSPSLIRAVVKVVGEGRIFKTSNNCEDGDHLSVHEPNNSNTSYVCGDLSGKSWILENDGESLFNTFSFISTSRDGGGTATGFMLSIEGFVFARD